jgi:hypothetical protein
MGIILKVRREDTLVINFIIKFQTKHKKGGYSEL